MPPISTLFRRSLCIPLLIVLAACNGGDDDVTDSRNGFEPIKCSTTPNPSA